MSNPNPSPATRFQPGNKLQTKRAPSQFTRVKRLLRETLADFEEKAKDDQPGSKELKCVGDKIAEIFVQSVINGDFRFHKELLERTDGKVSNVVIIEPRDPEANQLAGSEAEDWGEAWDRHCDSQLEVLMGEPSSPNPPTEKT